MILMLFSDFLKYLQCQILVIINTFKVQEETPPLLWKCGELPQLLYSHRQTPLPQGTLSQTSASRFAEYSHASTPPIIFHRGGNRATEICSASPRRTQQEIETGFESRSSLDPKSFSRCTWTSLKQITLISQQKEARQCATLDHK